MKKKSNFEDQSFDRNSILHIIYGILFGYLFYFNIYTKSSINQSLLLLIGIALMLFVSFLFHLIVFGEATILGHKNARYDTILRIFSFLLTIKYLM